MSDLYSGLKADDYDRVYSDAHLVRRIWRYLRSGARTIAAAALLIVGAALSGAALPVLISSALDQATRDGGWDPGWVGGALVVGVAVMGWALNWGRQALAARLVGDIVLRMQRDAADAALAKDTAFYDRNSVGMVLSRVTGDTEAFSTVLTLTLNFLSQALLVVLLGALVFAIDVQIGLLVLAFAPVLVGATLLFRRIARTAAMRTKRVMAKVSANVHESMMGISVAKSFGKEEQVYADFDSLNRLSYKVYLRQGLIYSLILPILVLLSGLGGAVVLVVGGRAIASGGLSPGEWYFALHAVGALWLPLTQVASFWTLFQQGLAASERVFALIDSDDAIHQSAAEPVGRPRGEIVLRDVDFSYGSAREPVFSGFSLRIPAKQTIAVVGHTGAGKSTLARLVCRAYEFDRGELLVDGHDIRTLDLAAYRRQVGVVPQHPHLFSGTMAENIGYARPGATRAEIEAAITALGADAWSRCIPLGLDDPISRSGAGMSLGQRQLISLARVFLQRPAIVVLDEPTASVDPLTDAYIQDALTSLFEDRTVVVIAHRLSTIRKVDRILVMARGKVVEDGSLEELLTAGGSFTQLYRTYYAHQGSADPAQAGGLPG